MKEDLIDQRDTLLMRRVVLEPGEASPWHTDACHRFSVIVQGDALALEYRDGETRSGSFHALRNARNSV
jgi:hypothetical protein